MNEKLEQKSLEEKGNDETEEQDPRSFVCYAVHLLVFLLVMTIGFAIWGEPDTGNAGEGITIGFAHLDTKYTLLIMTFLFFYFLIPGFTLGYHVQKKLRKFIGLKIFVTVLALTAIAVMPQLWVQLCVENRQQQLKSRATFAPPVGELYSTLKGKGLKQIRTVLQRFARKHRPESGRKVLESDDGAVYAVVAANGFSPDSKQRSLTVKPKGSKLNIFIAGDATHRWDSFLFRDGKKGGSITIKKPDRSTGEIVALTGTGGFGGLRGGPHGAYNTGERRLRTWMENDLIDGFYTLFGRNGLGFLMGDGGGGGHGLGFLTEPKTEK